MKRFIFSAFLVIAFVFSLQAQNWLTDFAEAKKIATENEQNIVLVFQGSDWCAPCIKLDREIWTSPEFQKYADEHYVLLKADFPRRRANKLDDEQQEKNSALAEKYDPEGVFPLVVVLNKNGEVLGKTGYKNIPPTAYIDELTAMEN